MAALHVAIKKILEADHPQTVRQVFYQLVTRNLVKKTELEYKLTVIRLLTDMRFSGEVKWAWIVDSSRQGQVTRTFDSVTDALNHTAEHYRRSAMRESDVYIEIWCEKEALAGIIYEAASKYDVPVIASKGLPSVTRVYNSFANFRAAAKAGKQGYLYQFGDHDPTGCLIPRSLQSRLDELGAMYKSEVPTVERVALTEEQIQKYRLPMRPTKRDGNSHANKFEGDSVELDALPSARLRELVQEVIEQHISQAETPRAARSRGIGAEHTLGVCRRGRGDGTLKAKRPAFRGWAVSDHSKPTTRKALHLTSEIPPDTVGGMGNFRSWHKRAQHDMLTETVGLTMEEYGQNTVLLDLIFAHSGAIPDDIGFVRGPLRCNVRGWQRVRDKLINFGRLYAADGGVLRSERADRELKSYKQQCSANQMAGLISSVKRAKKGPSGAQVPGNFPKSANKINYRLQRTLTAAAHDGADGFASIALSLRGLARG